MNTFKIFKLNFQAQTCDVLKNCHQNAECIFDERLNRFMCLCKPGNKI